MYPDVHETPDSSQAFLRNLNAKERDASTKGRTREAYPDNSNNTDLGDGGNDCEDGSYVTRLSSSIRISPTPILRRNRRDVVPTNDIDTESLSNRLPMTSSMSDPNPSTSLNHPRNTQSPPHTLTTELMGGPKYQS